MRDDGLTITAAGIPWEAVSEQHISFSLAGSRRVTEHLTVPASVGGLKTGRDDGGNRHCCANSSPPACRHRQKGVMIYLRLPKRTPAIALVGPGLEHAFQGKPDMSWPFPCSSPRTVAENILALGFQAHAGRAVPGHVE